MSKLSELPDEQLMIRFREGAPEAFDVLLERHQKPLYRFIHRFLHNEQASEEAFQDIFLKVIKHRFEYQDSAKFTTWLYTLARNFCIDELRKGRFRNHASFDVLTETGGESAFKNHSSHSPTPLNNTLASEVEKHLENALMTLDFEQREVFLLRHFQNMPFEEIASVSGISINTVKSRMRYALNHLQKHFLSLGLLEPSFYE